MLNIFLSLSSFRFRILNYSDIAFLDLCADAPTKNYTIAVSGRRKFAIARGKRLLLAVGG